jgi:hypothetical protein
MRRKRHKPIPPQDLDEPFGPPPIAYLYRCSICGEEMLVNEAILENTTTLGGYAHIK